MRIQENAQIIPKNAYNYVQSAQKRPKVTPIGLKLNEVRKSIQDMDKERIAEGRSEWNDAGNENPVSLIKDSVESLTKEMEHLEM